MKRSLSEIANKKNGVLAGVVLWIIGLAYFSSKYLPNDTVRMVVLGISFFVEISFIVCIIHQFYVEKSKGEVGKE